MKWWHHLSILVFFCLAFVIPTQDVLAINIAGYSNTLSDSGPLQFANHTYRFTPTVSIGAGGYIEFTLPTDFVMVSATTTFAERNVELYINGTPRTASSTASAGVDAVLIDRGAPQSVRYTLAPDAFVTANSQLELRIGNHTSGARDAQTLVSTTTGTTTIPADVEPIRNASTLGVHEIAMQIVDGGVVATQDFIVFLNEKVTITGDTTETIPPFRFNGAPTSTVGGTTLNVEISLETDELAMCRFDTASGTPFAIQPNTFSNTGFLQHSTVVTVTPDSFQQFFVRCIDDEGNFNIDDYLIAFAVSAQPTGTSNTEGTVSGNGTGTGNEGTGSGEGGGGTSGASEGQEPVAGGTSGAGGSGGGGGGGSGGSSGSSGGGGFESTDGPFESGDARIIISGTAYPGARVSILADGQFVESTTANNAGSYAVTIDGIASGAYTFGMYAEDSNGTKSTTFSTSFTVSGARASRLSNINITPTIAISPDPAEPGETVTISGYALPNATVSVEVGKKGARSAQSLTAVSDGNGRWTTSLQTTGMARDTYQVRANAKQLNGEETNYSGYVFFGLGQEAEVPLSADLNRDGSINLTDFSILLFWWQTSGGDSDPPADINQDGTVSLTDFSILLFNWTG